LFIKSEKFLIRIHHTAMNFFCRSDPTPMPPSTLNKFDRLIETLLVIPMIERFNTSATIYTTIVDRWIPSITKASPFVVSLRDLQMVAPWSVDVISGCYRLMDECPIRETRFGDTWIPFEVAENLLTIQSEGSSSNEDDKFWIVILSNYLSKLIVLRQLYHQHVDFVNSKNVEELLIFVMTNGWKISTHPFPVNFLEDVHSIVLLFTPNSKTSSVRRLMRLPNSRSLYMLQPRLHSSSRSGPRLRACFTTIETAIEYVVRSRRCCTEQRDNYLYFTRYMMMNHSGGGSQN
jgi:hypothetical protein